MKLQCKDGKSEGEIGEARHVQLKVGQYDSRNWGINQMLMNVRLYKKRCGISIFLRL
jgi:hypothetical protein